MQEFVQLVNAFVSALYLNIQAVGVVLAGVELHGLVPPGGDQHGGAGGGGSTGPHPGVETLSMPDTGTWRELCVLHGVLPGAVHLDAGVTGDSQVVTTGGPVEARG